MPDNDQAVVRMSLTKGAAPQWRAERLYACWHYLAL